MEGKLSSKCSWERASLAPASGVLQVYCMHPSLRALIFRASIFSAGLSLFAGCQALAGKAADAKTDAKSKEKTDSSVKGPVPQAEAPWNAAVIAAIDKLPLGGGYSISADARDALHAGIRWEEEKPVLRPKAAQPSFCSGATYLVFLVMLAQEQRAHRITLTPDVWRTLIVEGQADGQGVWGRWNANGPGTARLFFETGVGTNFTDLKLAKSGDFMKIFWNDSIGASEKGHSVVFIGTSSEKGVETVSFWSSNEPGGYGTKTVPRSKIKRMVFSRVEKPERLDAAPKLPEKDQFLSSLEEKTVTSAEAAEAIGIKKW